jgi:hypothetical protein
MIEMLTIDDAEHMGDEIDDSLDVITVDLLQDDEQDLPDTGLQDDIHRKVAEAAYYIAEGRGFEPGHELEDWIAAERQIADELVIP